MFVFKWRTLSAGFLTHALIKISTLYLVRREPANGWVTLYILHRPGGPDSTCFQPVLSLVAAYLETNHFKPFLASVLYNNYVKELIAMIQSSPRSLNSVQATLSTARTELESDTRSSCSSSCSSDRLPRSTSNTLLASSSGLRASTSFDCGELQDPDSIWRRRPVKNKVVY